MKDDNTGIFELANTYEQPRVENSQKIYFYPSWPLMIWRKMHQVSVRETYLKLQQRDIIYSQALKKNHDPTCSVDVLWK